MVHCQCHPEPGSLPGGYTAHCRDANGLLSVFGVPVQCGVRVLAAAGALRMPVRRLWTEVARGSCACGVRVSPWPTRAHVEY